MWAYVGVCLRACVSLCVFVTPVPTWLVSGQRNRWSTNRDMHSKQSSLYLFELQPRQDVTRLSSLPNSTHTATVGQTVRVFSCVVRVRLCDSDLSRPESPIWIVSAAGLPLYLQVLMTSPAPGNTLGPSHVKIKNYAINELCCDLFLLLKRSLLWAWLLISRWQTPCMEPFLIGVLGTTWAYKWTISLFSTVFNSENFVVLEHFLTNINSRWPQLLSCER